MLGACILSLLLTGASASASPHSGLLSRQATYEGDLTQCPGYAASNVKQTGATMTADLILAGPACNAYGTDIEHLSLEVTYDTGSRHRCYRYADANGSPESRIHVKISDANDAVYQVPESVFPPPVSGSNIDTGSAAIKYSHKLNPFSFNITRASSSEVLFDSSAAPFVFESQYLRLRTSLPENPNIYGFGEHSDDLRLNTTNYTRTLWSRDAYGIPQGQNLYGNHPVYLDHRGENGTHGVFLLNSNGMDLKINKTSADGQYLEYNTLGGIVDLYFLAGPTPVEVAQQYSGVVGTPVMMPYWGFGVRLSLISRPCLRS
jgi:alpha-glucosidase